MAQTQPETDNRLMILEAAERLISLNGLDSLTYSGLSSVTSLSKGTLYYYFPSKEELLVEIANRHVDRVTIDLTDIVTGQVTSRHERGGVSGDTVFGILKDLFGRIVSDRTRSVIHFHLVSEALQGNKALAERLRISYMKWMDVIEKNLDAMGSGDGKGISSLLVAALDGMIIQAMLGLESDPDTPAALMSIHLNRSSIDEMGN